VEFGRLLAVLVFFNRRQPKPRRLAGAMKVTFVIVQRKQVMAGAAVNVKSSTAITLSDIVYERYSNDFSCVRPRRLF
jgi:hypothetical protein